MTPCSWIIAISVGVAVLAFIVLVVFLAIVLVSLHKTLKTTNEVCEDLDEKIHSLDPLFHIVSGVGEALEQRVIGEDEKYCSSCGRDPCECLEEPVDKAIAVAQWVTVGLGLWKTLRKR